MSRYIDLQTLSEVVPGIHQQNDNWLELPEDHWFWQPMPAGYDVQLINGLPELVACVDSRSIEELQRFASSAINAQADLALQPITGHYPQTEIESWSEQCLEATAWLADTDAPTTLVDAISGPLDESGKHEFCNAIMDKANSYKIAVGTVIAWRRACSAWVESQLDRDALINFTPQFPEVPHD